jgi:hypothetical protein
MNERRLFPVQIRKRLCSQLSYVPRKVITLGKIENAARFYSPFNNFSIQLNHSCRPFFWATIRRTASKSIPF